MHADVRFLLVYCTLFSFTYAFYIPGWSIKSYKDGEQIPLFLNKIYSDNTQLQYAYVELPFVCPPAGKITTGTGLIGGASISLNLGEVLRGDRITLSDYELKMGRDDEARYLCSQTVDRSGLARAKDVVVNGYVAEWIVDNLPGATSFVTTDKSRKYYAAGFKMGFVDYGEGPERPRYYINNHVTIMIRHRRAPGRDGDQGKRVIVGFEVYAKSVGAGNRNDTGLPLDVNADSNWMELRFGSNDTGSSRDGDTYAETLVEQEDTSEDATLDIPYTYSVYFREEEKIEWQNRWDLYFADAESSKVHWLAIINSIVILTFLTTVVAVLVTRTVRGDIKGYIDGVEEGKIRPKTNRRSSAPRKSFDKGLGLLDQPGAEGEPDLSSDEDLLDENAGWKLIHGDVFRPPTYGGLLAPLVGCGTQLLFMSVGLLILSCIGVLNPSYRGGYVSVGMALFIFAGLFSGYYSARVYKTFGGQFWKKNFLVTATLVPGLLFMIIFILNLFVWAQASSNAIPFGTLVALLALWLLIQVPLVYIGSFYGYTRVGAWESPVKTNAIARQIPQHSWYFKGLRTALAAGFVPFLVIFMELLFVFKSMWQEKSSFYYMFGFFAVIFLIVMITVAEITIVATYLQLSAENYLWWWQSFLVGSASAFWIFAYCTWFYIARLHITGFVSSLLFFAYAALACAVYGLLMGTVGFLAAYWFVRRIYSAIKLD